VPAARLDAAEAVAQGRMKKKVLAAREALAGGVLQVILADSRRSQPIRSALAGEGTVFGAEPGRPASLPVGWAGVVRTALTGGGT
jgi:acetylglutamate/LysW-gamma-L-alpha-aminoadipate kinase